VTRCSEKGPRVSLFFLVFFPLPGRRRSLYLTYVPPSKGPFFSFLLDSHKAIVFVRLWAPGYQRLEKNPLSEVVLAVLAEVRPLRPPFLRHIRDANLVTFLRSTPPPFMSGTILVPVPPDPYLLDVRRSLVHPKLSPYRPLSRLFPPVTRWVLKKLATTPPRSLSEVYWKCRALCRGCTKHSEMGLSPRLFEYCTTCFTPPTTPRT